MLVPRDSASLEIADSWPDLCSASMRILHVAGQQLCASSIQVPQCALLWHTAMAFLCLQCRTFGLVMRLCLQVWDLADFLGRQLSHLGQGPSQAQE